MLGFGDELILESFRIPWLIWIQLLVMILLLLSGFTLFNSDLCTGGGGGGAPPTDLSNPTSIRMITVEEHTTVRDAGTSGGSNGEDNRSGEDNQSGEDLSLKGSMFPNHPCNYIGLAKQALLKCFGLDSSSESSTNHQHEKRE